MQQNSYTAKNLDNIFFPKSVAVLGTNNNRGTVPHDIFANLLESNFQGVLYPVSPACRSICCFKTEKYVIDIDEPVDLAVLVFPGQVCHLALEQCGQKGIQSAIVISAGFKEIGEKGRQREEKLQEIAEKYNISFIGPNCLGVINTDPNVRLNASFACQMPEEGNIGFLSQSGALCTAVLDYAQSKHIGFSKFVSFGNKADISEIDLLYYLKDDPQTQVILLYLEEIKEGRALMDVSRSIIEETGKPVLMLKSGRTSEGASAAASHTGSLAGSDEICTAAFEQSGIIRCETIEDMFHTSIALAYQPPPQNNRVAIITNAGGPGVLATDAVIKKGLRMARFEEETTKALKKALPATANINNPVDVIGDARADRYQAAIEAIMKDPNVDGIFVILTPQSMTEIEEIAHEVCRQAKGSEKPIYTSFMGEAEVAKGIDILQRERIPHYIVPESMAEAFARVYSFQYARQEKFDTPESPGGIRPEEAKAILTSCKEKNQTMLDPEAAQKVLRAYGIPAAEGGFAKTKDEASRLAETIGFPVAMKVVASKIVHKVDVQGVKLHIETPEEAAAAFEQISDSVTRQMPEVDMEGVLVQKMIPEGQEVILGLKHDPAFGPVLLFGLGGIFVEIFQDVSFRIAPVGPKGIRNMIKHVKSYPLLSGARGRAPKDIDAIIDCLSRLSQLALDQPDIKELDINPLIVLDEGKGCYAVDIKILV